MHVDINEIKSAVISIASNLYIVNSNVKLALTNLSKIEMEIVYLQNLVTNIALETSLNNLESMIQNFSLAPSQLLANNIMIEYDAAVKSFISFTMLNFDTRIKALGPDSNMTAIIEIPYYESNQLSVPFPQVNTQYGAVPKTGAIFINKQNLVYKDTVLLLWPKYLIPISRGDIEYLSKIITLRFTINNYLYGVDPAITPQISITEYNRGIATFYLNDIQQIKEGLKEAYRRMANIKKNGFFNATRNWLETINKNPDFHLSPSYEDNLIILFDYSPFLYNDGTLTANFSQALDSNASLTIEGVHELSFDAGYDISLEWICVGGLYEDPYPCEHIYSSWRTDVTRGLAGLEVGEQKMLNYYLAASSAVLDLTARLGALELVLNGYIQSEEFVTK